MRKPSTPISIRIVSHSVIAACVVAIGLIPATAATGMDDLERLASWLTGRWDNRAQAEAEVARGAPPDERHPRYAMEYVRLNTPHMAGVTFAIRNYGERGLAGPLRRVSLHRFELAADETTIVHEFMFLKDQAGWGDLGASLGPLTALRPTDVTANPGCRMYWSWQGDRFEGRTREGACVTSSFTDEPIRVEGHGVLRPDRLERHDRNLTLDGEEIPRAGGQSPEIFLKLSSQDKTPQSS